MNQSHLNILYFLYYQKTKFLYNDLYYKKPNKLPVLSYLQHNAYKWKVPVPVYTNNIIANSNIHVNTYVNKYIKNKLL